MNNALKYVKILEGTGITREQAEAHVQIISEFLEDELATKQDIRNLETKLDGSVARLDAKIDSAAERLEHKMLQLEYRMTIKLGTIVTIVMASATAVIKFF